MTRRRGRSRSARPRDSAQSSRRRGPRRRFYGVPSPALVAIASDRDYPELRRRQREQRRRQVRRRRLTALGVLTILAVAALLGLVKLVSGATAAATSVFLQPAVGALPATPFRRAT